MTVKGGQESSEEARRAEEKTGVKSNQVLLRKQPEQENTADLAGEKLKWNKMNPCRLSPGSSPHLFSVSGCWTELYQPIPPPLLGHTRLRQYHPSKIYTHIRNPARVGPTPEQKTDQLFCSHKVNQYISVTTRDREKETVAYS